MSRLESRHSRSELDERLDQWPHLERLERAFLREFLGLGIEVGTLLRSTTGTVRRVDRIVYSEQEGSENLPIGIQTKILSGNLRGKIFHTIREAALGARAHKFRIVRPVVRWTEALEEAKNASS